MYVHKEPDKVLRELIELQRDILLHTVINVEATESVAQNKRCSSRSIRDSRARTLKHLRSKITRHKDSGSPVVLIFVLLWLLVCYFGMEIIVEQFLPLHPWPEYVGHAITAAVAVLVIFRFKARKFDGLYTTTGPAGMNHREKNSRYKRRS